MAAERREYKGAAANTTLASGINGTATSISIAVATNWPTGTPGPFVIVIDPGLSNEEKIKIASRSGTTLTVATSGRGFDGTAAATHASGAVVQHVLSATDIDIVNKHAADVTEDDHTQYVHLSSARTVTAVHEWQARQKYTGDGPLLNLRRQADTDRTGLNITGRASAEGCLSVGVERDSQAGTSTARAVSASHYEMLNDGHAWYGDTGLTPGSTYSRTKRMEVDGSGILKSTASRFGAGAFGASGTYVGIGDLGDANNAYLTAEGTPSNVSLGLRSKGSGNVQLQNASGAVQFRTETGGNSTGETAVYLECNPAGSSVLKRVGVGAADSGGSGYRVLRVLN